MINLAVHNKEGQKVDSLKIDESVFGDSIRYSLLKQAIIMYHDNKRVGTATTKGRSMVSGSGHKLFRQKGTGNARIGNIRTGKRVGGGVTFAKTTRDFRKCMPKKQRRLARDSAILAKLLSNNVVVIDKLNFEKPKTRDFVSILNNLKIDRSCLVTIIDYNESLYKSAKNIPKISVLAVAELNAGDICRYHKMLFTKEAMMTFLNREQQNKSKKVS